MATAVATVNPAPENSSPSWYNDQRHDIGEHALVGDGEQRPLAVVHSRLMAPIAAKHGAHSRLNSMKENAAAGRAAAGLLKALRDRGQPGLDGAGIAPRRSAWRCPSRRYRCRRSRPNTLTTSSFATRPMTVATVARQSSKPSGAKIGETALPMCPRMLWSLSSTSPNTQLTSAVSAVSVASAVSAGSGRLGRPAVGGGRPDQNAGDQDDRAGALDEAPAALPHAVQHVLRRGRVIGRQLHDERRPDRPRTGGSS